MIDKFGRNLPRLKRFKTREDAIDFPASLRRARLPPRLPESWIGCATCASNRFDLHQVSDVAAEFGGDGSEGPHRL